MSTIILTRGTIVAPNGPDLTPNTSGYDNAGLFGPAFANLGGEHYTITWTLGTPFWYGTQGYVTGAALTINGHSYDMAAVPPGEQIETEGGPQYGLDGQGHLAFASFNSALSTLPVGAPNFAGPDGRDSYRIEIRPDYRPISNIGQATLQVYGHTWETVVNFAVPAPELGSGIVGLLMLGFLAAVIVALNDEVTPRLWQRQR